MVDNLERQAPVVVLVGTKVAETQGGGGQGGRGEAGLHRNLRRTQG